MAGGADLAGESAAVAYVVEPARPAWPQSSVSSPTLHAWPTWTRLSILVPRPICVSPTVARSIGGMGLDFDVVADDGDARLTHLVPVAAGFARKTETVAADDDAVLQQHAMAEAAVFADAGVGVGEEIVADARAAINRDETVQDRMVPDFDVLVHETVRADVRTYSDFGRAGDDRRGMHARRVVRRGMKQFDGAGEIEIRIRRTERGHARAGLAGSEKDRGGAGRFERGAVFAVDEERQLARVRFLDPGNAGDFEVFIALDSATECFRRSLRVS